MATAASPGPSATRRRSIASRRGRGLGDPPRRPLADARAARRRPRPRCGTTSRGPGPVASTSRYDGRSPERRWVYSWSRLLGLLSAMIGASATSSGSARLDEPVADRLEPEIEVERAGDAPRTPRRGATAGAGRCAATRLRRAAGTSRGRSGRRAGRDRWSRRSRRGGRSGTPSSSSGWRAKSASEMARLTTASPRNSSRSLWPRSGVGVLVVASSNGRGPARAGPGRGPGGRAAPRSASAGRTRPWPTGRARGR